MLWGRKVTNSLAWSPSNIIYEKSPNANLSRKDASSFVCRSFFNRIIHLDLRLGGNLGKKRGKATHKLMWVIDQTSVVWAMQAFHACFSSCKQLQVCKWTSVPLTKSLKNSPTGLPVSTPIFIRFHQQIGYTTVVLNESLLQVFECGWETGSPGLRPSQERIERKMLVHCWKQKTGIQEGFQSYQISLFRTQIYHQIPKYVYLSNFPFKNHHVGTIWMKHRKSVVTLESQFNRFPPWSFSCSTHQNIYLLSNGFGLALQWNDCHCRWPYTTWQAAVDGSEIPRPTTWDSLGCIEPCK